MNVSVNMITLILNESINMTALISNVSVIINQRKLSRAT